MFLTVDMMVGLAIISMAFGCTLGVSIMSIYISVMLS